MRLASHVPALVWSIGSPRSRNKRAAAGGLRSYLRIPTLTQKSGSMGGLRLGLPKGKKKRKRTKNKEKRNKKKNNHATKVPGQLLTLEEHAWRPLGYDQGRLGSLPCVSCSCLGGLVVLFLLGSSGWQVGAFGA